MHALRLLIKKHPRHETSQHLSLLEKFQAMRRHVEGKGSGVGEKVSQLEEDFFSLNKTFFDDQGTDWT